MRTHVVGDGVDEGLIRDLTGLRDVARRSSLTLFAPLRMGALDRIAPSDERVLHRRPDPMPLDVRTPRAPGRRSDEHLGFDTSRACPIPAEHVVRSVAATDDHAALLREVESESENLFVEGELVELSAQVQARKRRLFREEGERDVLHRLGAEPFDEIAGGSADLGGRIGACGRQVRRGWGRLFAGRRRRRWGLRGHRRGRRRGRPRGLRAAATGDDEKSEGEQA